MNNNEKIVLGSFLSVFLLISILAVYNKNTKNINVQNVINTGETSTNTNIIDETELIPFIDNEDEDEIQEISPTIITDTNPQVSPIANDIITKNISISPRCIGCGKCVRMDREHFKMVGELSTVTSQDNLDSQNLQMAIAICPVNAISIN